MTLASLRNQTIPLVISIGVTVSLCGAGVAPFFRSAHTVHPVNGKPITIPGMDGDARLLHSGWRISPIGRQISTSDMALTPVPSPDGRYLAFSQAGYTRNGISILDTVTEKIVSSPRVLKTYSGLVWSADGNTIYASGGANVAAAILRIQKSGEEWGLGDPIKIDGLATASTCVSALGWSPNKTFLIITNVTDGKVWCVNPSTGITKPGVNVGDHPMALWMSADGERGWVACLGNNSVTEIKVDASGMVTKGRTVSTGSYPIALAGHSDGRLFAACSGADRVDVIDTREGRVSEVIRTSTTPRSPVGSTPVALAIAPDGSTLYVANADNNNLCLVDVARPGRSHVKGFIPTGWYPSAVAVSKDGKKVFAFAGKGSGIGPNPLKTAERLMSFSHMGNQLSGMISVIDYPDDKALAAYSKSATSLIPYRDSQLSRSVGPSRTAIPMRVGAKSPIKYVLYIIKENRTYDQVLGDMPQGNGDPNLCLFGRQITPNHHALAEEFVLLDNLYCNGEVSQDGHPWSTSAYVTAYTQRSWVQSYSGKGQSSQTPAVTNPPAGFLWEAAMKKGLSVYNFGEMRGHASWQGKESGPFVGKVGPNIPPPGRDYEKADIFIEEFKEFDKKNQIPRLMVMSLGENHTRGTAIGAFSPRAAVASNDLALGKIVEAISKSSVWKEFAIFVIEDDAQNGPDHVDAHRTVGLVISPYTRRGYVDSTMYQTASMLRTMELILGLGPLTQYDASASPMSASFTSKADVRPYSSRAATYNLQERNLATAYGSEKSSRMDWAEYDKVDEDALNRILWHNIKGRSVAYPGPTRSALIGADGRPFALSASKKTDDD